MIVKLVYIFMPVTIALAFLWAPSARFLGHASRIIYFHVPVAWVSVLAFVVAGILSILYLFKKNTSTPDLEKRAAASAMLGLVFCVLTLITGSIWAKTSWGTFWNWDPRETSIVILLLIYIAFFSLRASLQNSSAGGRVSASYLVFAMIIMPFFVFVVPRVYPSLHPDPVINPEKKLHLEGSMRLVLFAGIISFTLLYAYLYTMSCRILALEEKIEDADDE